MEDQWSARVDAALDDHGRQLGALHARVAVHDEKHRSTEDWLKDMAGDVKAIRGKFDSASGGWKLAATLGIPTLIVGAIVASIGAGLHWIVTGGR